MVKLHFQKTKITVSNLNNEQTIEGYSDKGGLFEVPLFTLLKVTEEEGHPGKFQGSIKEGEIIIDHNKVNSDRIRALIN
ncbi:MAG: hypothetical protein WD016_10760 [Balneolaceae bacterium]